MISSIKIFLFQWILKLFEKKHHTFLRINYNFWKKKKEKKWDKKSIVICEYNTNSYMGLGLSSLASLIALKQGAKVLYITPNKVNIGSGSILQLSFPHTLFKNYADLLNEKNVTEIDTISKKIFSKLKRPEDILNIKYNNVTIGTFIYDTILRTGNWKAYISELNSEVESVIKSAIKLCYALDELAKKFNIVSAVFSIQA